MFSKIVLLSFFITSNSWASYEAANRTYGRGTVSLSGHRRTLIELVKGGYYFSTVPWMKDYIVQTDRVLDPEMEETLDKIIYHTGVKVFESLSLDVLKRSRSGNVRYIIAKKLFKKGLNDEALNELNGISGDHPAYPFIANLKATIYSSLGNNQLAESHFRDCIRSSESRSQRSESKILKTQLQTNRDYCVAGVGRVHFASGEHRQAGLTYLDISKDSFVWPEILFEEAWSSYYLKNYNRTLGKLVSYRSPIFDFIFKPEVEVLKALTYMKTCLYEDAKKTADDFYSNLLNPSKDLRTFLLNRGKDYRYFYTLMADHEEKRSSPLPIVDHILRSIRKDWAYKEMKSALLAALAEYNQLSKLPNSSMNANLIKNIKTVADDMRTTIGAYIRSGIVSKYAELYSAFQGMSYIKLEVLAQRKERLYQTDLNEKKKRGDVKYIERNDKQYFWNFNGEFWADELGDYVFALRSEC